MRRSSLGVGGLVRRQHGERGLLALAGLVDVRDREASAAAAKSAASASTSCAISACAEPPFDDVDFEERPPAAEAMQQIAVGCRIGRRRTAPPEGAVPQPPRDGSETNAL